MAQRWHCAATKPGRAPYANGNLVDQGFETYLPVLTVGEHTELLFPNYVFIEFDRAADNWQSINSTRGVRRLLPLHLELPEAIPDGFVDALKARIEADEQKYREPKSPLPRLYKGDTVAIVMGPLLGFEAVITVAKHDRIRAEVSLFGTKVEANIFRHQIELVRRAQLAA